jgi:hypothetical protein
MAMIEEMDIGKEMGLEEIQKSLRKVKPRIL